MATQPTFAAVSTFDKIQSYVTDGTLSYPSYILCRDDWTWAFVDKDSTVKHIKGYQQESIISVDTLPTEDIRTDAFYFCNGIGYLYINNSFVPVFSDVDNPISSYDQLSNIPIINQYGTVASPIVVSDLDNGLHAISGQYKIGGNLETVFVTTSKIMFLIDSDETHKYITKINPQKICLYTMDISTSEVKSDNYVTNSWILAQGYTTETFVNKVIQDLYDRIISELKITKVSQLENDIGYLTTDDFEEIGDSEIANLF